MPKSLLVLALVGPLACAEETSVDPVEDASAQMDAGVAVDSGAGSDAEIEVWAPELRAEVLSSTRIRLSWRPAAGVEAYEVRASEAVGGTERVWSAQSPLELEGLKSATPYTLELRAGDRPSVEVSVQTQREIWEVQTEGGDGVASALRIVADGNVKIHAFRYGAGAPEGLQGRVRLYYGPTGRDNKGLSVALSRGGEAGWRGFDSLTGQAGLVAPPAAAPLVGGVATGQGVPTMAGLVALFFEAPGADGRTRLLRLDSADGLVGEDFNTGAATVCRETEDYAPGGGCTPSVVIGVEGDPGGSPLVQDARQSKLGYPTLEDWRWDEAAGTFMFVTVGRPQGCAQARRNQGYAVFDGADWALQYAPDGCPLLFEDVQAPSPVHLGQARYKVYFGKPGQQMNPGRLPYLGPKQVLYASGELTGDAAVVDFEDWEPREAAREMDFVWPSGTPLTEEEEGYLDDFVFLHPTGDPELQIAYLAMTDGQVLPFATLAVLSNP